MMNVYTEDLPVWRAFQYWGKHIIPISFWMGLSGIGRAMQMGLWSSVWSQYGWWLEAGVALARLVTIAVIVGNGQAIKGLTILWRLISLQQGDWREIGRYLGGAVRGRWLLLLVNIGCLSVIAIGINAANQWLAASSGVLPWLKAHALIDRDALPKGIFFLLKNLTIIPYTLIFEYKLLRWCLREGQALHLRMN